MRGLGDDISGVALEASLRAGNSRGRALDCVHRRGSNSTAECDLPKVEVAGSSPVSRSSFVRAVALSNGFHGWVGWSHGQAACGGTRTYHAWKSMHQRCRSSTRADWPRYGGRGIIVCERWNRFENFLADMGASPPELSLDRINNDGNYEPGNCRWATREQQTRNRRQSAGEHHWNAKLTVRDVITIRELARSGMTQRALALRFGVSHANIGLIVRRQEWRLLSVTEADGPRAPYAYRGRDL